MLGDDGSSYSAVSLGVTDSGVEVWGVGKRNIPGVAALAEAEWSEIKTWNVLGEDGLRIEMVHHHHHEGDDASNAHTLEFKSGDAAAIGLAMAAAGDEESDVAI